MKLFKLYMLLIVALALMLLSQINVASAQTHIQLIHIQLIHIQLIHIQLIQALVTDADITHTAINNGSWFDNQTWQNGQVPTTDS